MCVQGEADVMAKSNLIQQSFELAAGRCEDLTPLVYRRLFRQHPEAEAMFRSGQNDLSTDHAKIAGAFAGKIQHRIDGQGQH